MMMRQEKEGKEIKEVKRRISVILPGVQDLYIYEGKHPRVKGKKTIYLRVRDGNGVPYDINTLVYVCLHEVAHIICEVHDTESGTHSPEFYKIFDKLIDIGTEKEIFNPSIPLHKDFIT